VFAGVHGQKGHTKAIYSSINFCSFAVFVCQLKGKTAEQKSKHATC